MSNVYEKMELEISPLDRYIPSRALIDFENAYGKLMELPGTELQEEISVSALCKSSKRLELVRQLDKVANINERILKITPSARTRYVHPWTVRLWPCQPRKKPIIRDERLLDLPDFNCGFHLNPIDWGRNNCLATSVANKVLIGRDLDHPKVTKENVFEYERDRATAVCWSPNGENLAFGSETGFLNVWSFFKKKIIGETVCCARRNCAVTVIHWHPDSEIYAWGCTKGRLSVRSVDQYLIVSMEKAHKGYICGLKYSPRGNYLCSSGRDAFLRIWKGPNYDPCMEIEMVNPSRAVAWHPWRTGLLAVGEGPPTPASLSLWNVNTAELIFIKKLPPSTSITALDFNHITGELVFAQSNTEDFMETYSDIVVMGGPHYVIDSVNNIAGTVFSLMWNADYTKLGAGISSETLRIWNFLKPTKRKRSAINTCEDLTALAMKKFNGIIR